jgi:SWI/SNF-related matrix-associated actin-dependent regulator 1 of chromatin subfamily A
MNMEMNINQMHAVVKAFVGLGAPNTIDDQGPNKMDWHFFMAHANRVALKHEHLPIIASRLWKYRNTQMSRVFAQAGLPSDSTSVANMLTDTKTMEIVPRVTFERITEQWTNRWGKSGTSQRTAIHMPFIKAAPLHVPLKQALDFPALKFNGDTKTWSIDNTKESYDIAVRVLTQAGAEVIPLDDASFSKPKPKVAPVKEATVTLKGTALHLAWPWLENSVARYAVMNEVKETQGRVWNASTLTWSVALTEGAPLVDRLRALADRRLMTTDEEAVALIHKWATALADAIAAVPEVATVMEDRAARIALSSATVLNEEDTRSMAERLAEQFPEGRELYPFQYVGVQFVQMAGGRALIGDDMGIGKTIQAIAHIALNEHLLPALVVCPASVKFNWEKELAAWLPSHDTHVISGRTGDLPDADVYVCNYDLMSYRQDQLHGICPQIVVLDESHYVKNYKAKRTEATLEVCKESESVVCLSGTAITNRPNEFFSTLNLLRPEEFPSSFEYGKRYCAGEKTRFGWDFSGASNEDELHARTRDFTIRRLKSEVLTELPDKVRTLYDVDIGTAAMKAYKSLLRRWENEWESYSSRGAPLPAGFALNMLTDLRHAVGRHKVKSAVEYLQEYREQTGKPVVLFAHHKDVLGGIKDALNADKNMTWRIGAIVGEMPAAKRQATVEAFQAGDLDVVLCSTVAAKEGITLTAADTTVFVEREWVPGWEEQAEDRVNRIGQESQSVSAVYLTARDTIDEMFNAVVEAKREVVRAVLDGGDVNDRSSIIADLLKDMAARGQIPAGMADALLATKTEKKVI